MPSRLPHDLLQHQCCPETHRNMLALALGEEERAIIDTMPMLLWAVKHKIQHAVFCAYIGRAQRAISALAQSLVTLELIDIDPCPISPLLKDLRHLRGLSIAMSVGFAPGRCCDSSLNLSALPSSLESLRLVRVHCRVELPAAIESLSISFVHRKKQLPKVKGSERRLTHLRLDKCDVDAGTVQEILETHPRLVSLELPRNPCTAVYGLPRGHASLVSLELPRFVRSTVNDIVCLLDGRFPVLKTLVVDQAPGDDALEVGCRAAGITLVKAGSKQLMTRGDLLGAGLETRVR